MTKDLKNLTKKFSELIKVNEAADKALLKTETSVKEYDKANEQKAEAAEAMLKTLAEMLVNVDILLCVTDRLDIHEHHAIRTEKLF